MERITSAQPPPCMAKHPSLEILDMQGMDFPLFVYKPRRGAKRGEDSKETYKLPHRLIEKKRRDRINECIAQLKDLLPEHLKLTTLGHLEKAVVLELTLKHMKALTVLLEQHQQKILALQSGLQSVELSPLCQESSEEIFRSGFEMCAKEVLQYLANHESGKDLTPAHMISHLRKVVPEVLHTTPGTRAEELCHKKRPAGAIPEGHGKNCVPVIQRIYPQGGSELSGSDTDTDSGYGGELEKRAGYCDKDGERAIRTIKRESEEPLAKRPRAESSEEESLSAGEILSGYTSFPSQHPPLCMPFYLLPPGAAYLPTMLEKHWYPRCMPVLYPGMGGSALATSPDKHPPSLVLSPRLSSPVAQPCPMDSPALLQVLKQVPPLNLESKD